MRVRLRRVLADPRFRWRADALLALALLVAPLVEIGAGRPEWSGPVGLEVALAFVCSVPLAWRRSAPLVVAAVVVAGALATGAVVAPVQGPFESFVAFEIALYSVGVHATRRAGLVTLGTTLAAGVATWLVVSRAEPGTYYGDWLPMLAWAVGAWAVGRVVHGRNRRTLELERLTVALEAEREARANEAVVVERARIARELHDVVAHNISVIGVQAAAAGRILREDQPEVGRALEAIETTGRATVDEMRRMLGILRSSDDELGLAPQPSLRDLDALLAQVRSAGLDVELEIVGEPRPLPAGLDLSAYRIVQEAVTNALKHAGPTRARVTVRYTADAVELEVVDDGGRVVASSGTGNGLVGMRERAALFGGELRAGVRLEGGWAVHAVLPVGAA